MNITARNIRATKPTMKRKKGWSNLRCINQVKTNTDLIVENIMAPNTEYSPRSISVMPIDMNVSVISDIRI